MDARMEKHFGPYEASSCATNIFCLTKLQRRSKLDTLLYMQRMDRMDRNTVVLGVAHQVTISFGLRLHMLVRASREELYFFSVRGQHRLK